MKKKSKFIILLEYAAISSGVFLVTLLPTGALKWLSDLIGDLFYGLFRSRREIAISNLRHAFKNEKNDYDIKMIARGCCRSFILTAFDIIKFRRIYRRPDALHTLRKMGNNIDGLLQRAKDIHDKTNGCIFVSPHFGNWEALPHASSLYGIPLSVVVRPMDNPYLEKLLYQNRVSTGQAIIPKKNALFVLHRTLNKGKSIGILPDQSTIKGISVDFFGRKASTTPVPAMLAISHNRPVVVVACYRKEDSLNYDGFVSDPIWPGTFTSYKGEIIRITNAINAEMESIIRRYPEQYLWVHKRWKVYEDQREAMSSF